MLQLTRPLVVFDLETTGLDRDTDRIVSIALYKIHSLSDTDAPQGMLHRLVNPGRPIPESATAIHGITDEMVSSCPPFAVIAPQLLAMLDGCDLAGFGANYFDVPMLHKEFARAGINWQPGHCIDAGTLFKIKQPRSLEAAVRYYCHREHVGAHSADSDTLATAAVLMAQLRRYTDLPDTVEELARYTNHGNARADVGARFYIDSENVYRFGFGKYKDHPCLDHPEFLEWMLYKADFPVDTERVIHYLLNEVATRPGGFYADLM